MKTIPPSHSRAAALLAVWSTVLFWGLSFVSSKTILNSGVPPMTMACIRFVVATIVLNLFLKKDIIPLAASGLFGVTIHFFFEARGIK